MAEKANKKREVDDGKDEDSDDDWVGPSPSEAVQPKKRKSNYFDLYII